MVEKYLYTCYCSFPDDPRDFYSEEIDVEGTSVTDARKKAEQLLLEGYDKRLRVRRVVRRGLPELLAFHLS